MGDPMRLSEITRRIEGVEHMPAVSSGAGSVLFQLAELAAGRRLVLDPTPDGDFTLWTCKASVTAVRDPDGPVLMWSLGHALRVVPLGGDDG